MIITMLSNTPLYAWMFLFLIISGGIKALKDRKTTILKMTLMPIAFFLWGCWSFFTTIELTGTHLFLFFSAILLCAISNYFLWKTNLKQAQFEQEGHQLTIPGNRLTLITGIVTYLIKYAVTASTTMNSSLLEEPTFILLFCILQGLSSGLFIGSFIFKLKQFDFSKFTAIKS